MIASDSDRAAARETLLRLVDEILGAAHRPVRIELERGMMRRPNLAGNYYVFEPTDGYTLTVKINGGAVDFDGPPTPIEGRAEQ